jgi:hypothetical protein
LIGTVTVRPPATSTYDVLPIANGTAIFGTLRTVRPLVAFICIVVASGATIVTLNQTELVGSRSVGSV